MSKHTQKRIKIVVDGSPTNPREDTEDNHMICFHGRYNLGDTDNSLGYSKRDLEDSVSSFKELKRQLREEHGAVVLLPVYLYDHSGLAMNTTGFDCQWDSGLVGCIYVTKEDIKDAFSDWKSITPKRKGLIEERLVAAVEEYDYYLRGECYGYVTEELTCEKCGTWEEIDSCYGFLGPYKMSGILECARQEADPETPVFDTDGTLVDQ